MKRLSLALDINEFKCYIKMTEQGHLCGYVVIPESNAIYGKDYNNLDINVHGGLTFSGLVDNEWLIGFDCAHLGDLIPRWAGEPSMTNSIWRDPAFVKEELERLTKQLL